ncbi:MAG TPA: hypothetical protein VFI84_02460 [Candidatus Saccharimonadales bacterium]|nr:hypothetical protein [Candidatus Saccharimonadales bacterium]
MDNLTPKQQLVERLKTANNVLVTVSANPSVDQLAACIGLTLMLNKQGKHATAVFSGEVPSTLEFLKPEETLEKNTDSLRDFIISLDKSKADKLRYKVEDKIVKIFITPYRTSLSADDLEFSQGDFNVDVVVALGVKEQQDLDNAITSHGRILHDATVATVNTTANGGLGNINWNDTQSSSLCELVVDLGRELDKNLMDNQIATALLTGIVAETARFSNEKTTPQTMSVSAELMKAGANQQLVASELEGPAVDLRKPDNASQPSGQDKTQETPSGSSDGMLEIGHTENNMPELPEPTAQPRPEPEPEPKDDFKDDGTFDIGREAKEPESHLVNKDSASKLITEPPTLGGQLTANSEPEGYDPSVDPLTASKQDASPLLTHDSSAPQPTAAPGMPEPAPTMPPMPPPTPEPPAPQAWTPPNFAAPNPPPAETTPSPQSPPPVPEVPKETLSQLEQEVGSSHLDNARNEVERALSEVPAAPEPVQALNAQPIDLTTPGPQTPLAPVDTSFDPAAFGAVDPGMETSPTMPLPSSMPPSPTQTSQVADPSIPPVPPPLPFQFGGPQGK